MKNPFTPPPLLFVGAIVYFVLILEIVPGDECGWLIGDRQSIVVVVLVGWLLLLHGSCPNSISMNGALEKPGVVKKGAR